MKKIIYFLMIIGLSACYNQEKMFDDYDVQAVYFPFQYPVRTLSLGNDRLDNSLDKQHKFNIGVSIGGIYMENTKNWTVNFAVDNTLVSQYLVNAKGDTLKVLPAQYYTMNPASTVTIPKGSFSGLIEVQLSDAFFQDPVAIKGNYVIPVKIINSPDDVEILRGTPAEGITNPNIHLSSDWQVLPRDYTLFAVKYVNPYHGTWLRRGKMQVKNSAGDILSTVVYRSNYVEFDVPVVLTTTKLNEVTGTLNVENEKWNVSLSVDNDKNIVVKSLVGSPVTVSGTGKYVENGDTWGGTPENPTLRDVLHLNYTYTRSNGNICQVSDTLVFRDRGIKVEEARPTLK
ncbi:MAG: DUF1735 domain-containing protein [Paludibacter sp.]|nr:DUF1735 domain-containing protein [Paludibacter sp.]